MSEPRYWRLTTTWEPLPAARYTRHEVTVPESVVRRIERCEPWATRPTTGWESSRGRYLEDFPFCFAPLWSARAVEVLRPLRKNCGEFLPVSVHRSGSRLHASYFCFNCTVMCPVVRARSLPRRAWLAHGIPDPNFNWEFTFEQVPPGVAAFRPKYFADVLFVSRRVARTLQVSGLVGWSLTDQTGQMPAVLSPTPVR